MRSISMVKVLQRSLSPDDACFGVAASFTSSKVSNGSLKSVRIVGKDNCPICCKSFEN